jgi:hypothetical protein
MFTVTYSSIPQMGSELKTVKNEDVSSILNKRPCPPGCFRNRLVHGLLAGSCSRGCNGAFSG